MAFGFWLAVALEGVLPISVQAVQQPASDSATGKAAYDQYCARCHGVQGHGDGVEAKRFYPRPRDLTLGVYKFRTTASGTPPTDEDLFNTLTHGLPGSNMPDWQHLDEATRWQLVYYLKSLAPIFEQTQPAPVKMVTDPGPKRADLGKAKALYAQLGCVACHGASGRANGTSAAGLVDDWGMPIRPVDLTQGWSYRGGNSPRAVMTRVLAGIDGAGMPSYADAISPEDAWQLAYYVASLQEPAHWNPIAHAASATGELPASLDDPRWESTERTDLRLRNAVTATGEWTTPPTLRAVTFQAMYNAQEAVFRLTWDDPTHGVEVPADAVAIMFKPTENFGDLVTLQAWPYAGAPQLDLCYWSAKTRQIVESLATDFENVTAHPSSQPPLQGTAAYEDGRWHLLIRRPRKPASPQGAAMIPDDAFASIAVTLWDGGNVEAHAVSPWIDVVPPEYEIHRAKR